MANEREAILANIKTVLEGITVGGGYNHTVALVQRRFTDWLDMDRANFPGFMVVAGPERNTTAGARINHYWEVIIHGGVYEDLNDPSTPQEKLIADMIKALQLDPSRGGNAGDQLLTNLETDEGYLASSSIAVFEARYEITYYTLNANRV